MQGSLPHLDRLPQIIAAHGQNMADELAIRVSDNLSMKHETGEFRGSIRGESEPTGDGTVIRAVSGDPLAEVKLEPTAPHDIYPVNAKALFWEGAEHPVMHVHHPGTVGLGVQVEAMAESLMSVVDEEWDAIVQELAIE